MGRGAATAGDVLVIRAADGKVLWTKSLGVGRGSAPFIAGDGVYLSLSDNRIVALALESGEPRWERTLPGKPGELLVLDDRLFVGADDKCFYCLNTKHGKNRWRWRTGGKPVGAAAIDEKHVYYIGLDNILWALDRNGGTLKWKAQMPGAPVGRPHRARHGRRRGCRAGRGVWLSDRDRRAAWQGVVPPPTSPRRRRCWSARARRCRASR